MNPRLLRTFILPICLCCSAFAVTSVAPAAAPRPGTATVEFASLCFNDAPVDFDFNQTFSTARENWPLSTRSLNVRDIAFDLTMSNVTLSQNAMLLDPLYADQYDEILRTRLRILDSIEQQYGSNHPETTRALQDVGLVYLALGRYTDAETVFLRAVRLCESQGSNTCATAYALNNLAVLYRRQGRYAEVEPLYLRSLSLLESCFGPAHPDCATIANNLAVLKHVQAIYEDAEPLYLRAIAIREQAFSTNDPGVAEALCNLATLYYNRGAYHEALRYHTRAAEIRAKAYGRTHPAVAESMNNIAVLYFALGMQANAESLYRAALGIRCAAYGTNHPAVAESLNNLATLYKAQNRLVEAEPLYLQALEIRNEMLGPAHPDSIQTLSNLAALHAALGNTEKAITYYARAFDLLEQVTVLTGGETYARRLRDLQYATCSRFLACLARLQTEMPEKAGMYLPLAFTAMERSRARLFLDQLQESAAGSSGGLNEKDRIRRDHSYAVLRAAREKLDRLRLLPQTKSTRDQRIHYARRCDAARIQCEELEKEFSQRYPRYNALRATTALSLRQVQQDVLVSNELLISYWEGDSQLYACVIGPDTYRFCALPVAYDELFTRLALFRMALASPTSPCEIIKREGLYFYTNLIAPLLPPSNISSFATLYIIPHESLETLPFDTLVTSTNGLSFDQLDYLFKTVPVAYIPSVSVLKTIRQQQHDPSVADNRKPVILFGDPVYTANQSLSQNSGADAALRVLHARDTSSGHSATRMIRMDTDTGLSLTPLPGSFNEVHRIADIMYDNAPDSHIYTAGRASEHVLKELSRNGILKQYRYVHFATHGILPGPKKGLAEACLALSLYGDPDEDGLLKMSEICGLNLDADMVTLSACQTGLPRGDEIMQGASGLAQAFLYAGSPRLTVTLWSIDDTATTELMTAYYRALARTTPNTSTLAALNTARQHMIEDSRYRHPYYWAPFILIGEWR